MKIGHELRTQSDTAYSRPSAGNTNEFHKTFQSRMHQVKEQEFQQLMKDITQQGNKLARFRSFRDLAKFKRMVKRFLQKAVKEGMDLEQSHSFGVNGQSRHLTVVKQIDEKLMELTEEVMNQEKKTVDILGLIGEIKGLLINIYM
ncbi:YaaR family protein [Virgibacillus kimchii]